MSKADPTDKCPDSDRASRKSPEALELAFRRTEKQLRLTMGRFNTALRGSPITVFNQDTDLRYTWIFNPVLHDLAENMIGKLDRDLWERPEDAEKFESVKRAVLETGLGRREEVSILHGGVEHTLDLSIEPLRNAYGTLVGITGASVNITEFKNAARALREKEARYRSLFENNLDATFSVDVNGRFLAVNPAAELLSGYCQGELQQMAIADLCTPDRVEATMAIFAESFQSPQAGETAFVCKDGRRVELFVTGMPIRVEGEVKGVFCIARDITEQKKSKLRRSLRMELLDLVAACKCSNDLAGQAADFAYRRSGCDTVGIRLWNSEERLLSETRGFPREFEALDRLLSLAPHRELSPGTLLACICGREDLAPWLTERGSFWTNDMAAMPGFQRWTGSETACRSLAIFPIGPIGKLEGLLLLGSMQTNQFTAETIALWESLARKLSGPAGKLKAKEALLKAYDELEWRVRERTAELEASNAALSDSEARFRQMSENIHEVFWLVAAADSQVLYVSPAFEEIWGRPRAMLYQVPDKWLETIHPEDRNRVAAAFRWREDGSASMQAEYRIVRPCGSLRWIWERGSPVRDAEGRVYRIARAARDITSRKTAEEELNRTNRALLVLKGCDEAMARATNESDLLYGVCDVIVKTGGMKLAWVGFAEHDEKKTVRPAASAGDTTGYLNGVRITWGEDDPCGHGPTGVAIRTHKVNLCHSVHLEARMKPWRSKQIEAGFEGSISLPLLWNGHCLGALTIYSAQPSALHPKETELLEQLAGNLTFGIIALRTRAEREFLQIELLKISEREKQLIAQELHDGLCQHLAGTALMGSLLHRRLAARDDPDAGDAERICQLLNTGVNEARNLSHGLHPVRNEPDGLMDALSALVETVTNLFHIRCTFQCPEPVLLKHPAAGTHLFRIAQEAINNAMKHGQATRVVITLKLEAGMVTLSIRDNGIGIPRKRPSTGMGMRIMTHRATAIGATLKVSRAGRKGTIVCCTLPLPIIAAGEE